MEARELAENQRYTIADSSHVGALKKKWEGLLEGLPRSTRRDEYALGVTAMLMENQLQYLQSMHEETRSVNIGPFTKFIFPILRRVFPNLIASELVSVQPMTAPIGAIFFLDFIYGSSKGGTTAGTVFPKEFDKNYSSEFVDGERLVTGDGVKYGGGGDPLSLTLTWTPVRPLDANRGYSLIIRELSATTGATVQEATDDGQGGFTGAVAAGTVNYSNGAVADFKFTNPPAAGNPVKAFYWYDGELNTAMPTISLDIKKAPIEAEPRRIKALWSVEALEDLRNLHGIDAEMELVAIVAQEMGLEIDREIIHRIHQSATGTTGTFNRVPPAGINELDHLRSMITVISSLSAEIHQKTLRAPANWMVTSPAVSALLTQLQTHGDYRPLWVSGGESPYGPANMPRPMTQHGQYPIYTVGTLMGQWAIYVDPFFTRDQILLGLKGDSYLDSGFVWAPYIPLQVSQTFMDPNDGSLRKMLRTRYASKLLRPDYYGTMRILNL